MCQEDLCLDNVFFVEVLKKSAIFHSTRGDFWESVKSVRIFCQRTHKKCRPKKSFVGVGILPQNIFFLFPRIFVSFWLPLHKVETELGPNNIQHFL